MDPHGHLLSAYPGPGADFPETSGSVSCVTDSSLDMTSHRWHKILGEDHGSTFIALVCLWPIGIAFNDARET